MVAGAGIDKSQARSSSVLPTTTLYRITQFYERRTHGSGPARRTRHMTHIKQTHDTQNFAPFYTGQLGHNRTRRGFSPLQGTKGGGGITRRAGGAGPSLIPPPPVRPASSLPCLSVYHPCPPSLGGLPWAQLAPGGAQHTHIITLVKLSKCFFCPARTYTSPLSHNHVLRFSLINHRPSTPVQTSELLLLQMSLSLPNRIAFSHTYM